jgi:hypothetical protein
MPPELFDNELIQYKLIETEHDDFVRSLNMNGETYAEPTPVVFVEGFLGPGKPTYWGPLEKVFSSSDNKNDKNQKLKNRRCIYVTPGCVSSLHDRAVEIFYQIKGGRGIYILSNII